MNKNSKAHLVKHRFKPGQSGNPEGGRAHNKEIKRIKHLTQDQIAELGSLLLAGNVEGIKSVVTDKDASALKVWFATIIMKGITKGDPLILNTFLDRVVGKIPERVQAEHIHLVDQIKRMEHMTDSELVKVAQGAIEMMKDDQVYVEKEGGK